MAKKKDPQEAKIDYNEIHNKDMAELAEAIPQEKVDEAVEEIKEEKTKIEEKAETVEDREETEEVDYDQLTKDISEKVTKDTVEKITKALTGEEASKEEVDEFTKFAKDTWEKEGRNPSYKEALEFVAKKVEANVEAKREAAERERVEKEEAAKSAEEARTKELNTYIDNELDELISGDKIPKIVDKSDENDPGVKARKAIFQAMLEVNTERAKSGKPPIYSPKIIFYEHYKDPNQQPAGEDAPIAGRSTHSGGESKEFGYQDIHNKSFMDIMLGR